MKFIAIIPARYASTRFPGKPLALLGGIPIIQHVYERVSKIIPDTFVATAGVGLPILTNYNNRSMLNISASYEQLRSQVGSSLTERNFLLTIGLTFNERWFKKWLVD